MHVDGPLFERVLINLLENAHKYAGARASIGIRAEADARQLSLEVWDNGPDPGRPEQTIFDKFARGNKESAILASGWALPSVRPSSTSTAGPSPPATGPRAAPHSVLHCREKRPLNWKSYLRNCD